MADVIADMAHTSAGDARDVVNHVALLLGIPLSEAAAQQYVQYLNYEAQTCNNQAVQQGKCTSTQQSYYLQLVGFVASPEFYNFEKKFRGLVVMMTRDPRFVLK